MRTLFYTLPQLTKILSGRNIVRACFLYLQLLFFYLCVRSPFAVHYDVNLTYNNKSFKWNLKHLNDIDSLKVTFLLNQYDWSVPYEIKTVIDLGAHTGETAIYYHTCYPEAKIFAIEPDPDNYQRLLHNVEGIENIVPLNIAVSDKDGSALLYKAKSSMGNSLRKRQVATESVTINTVTLDSLLSKCKVTRADIIKFDIEGAESQTFSGLNPSNYANAYIGEYHGDLTDESIDEFIKKFSMFKVELSSPFTTNNRYFMRALIKVNESESEQ